MGEKRSGAKWLEKKFSHVMFWGQQFPRLLSKKNMKKKKFNISLPSSQLETLCQPHLLCRLDEPKLGESENTKGTCDIMPPRKSQDEMKNNLFLQLILKVRVYVRVSTDVKMSRNELTDNQF